MPLSYAMTLSSQTALAIQISVALIACVGLPLYVFWLMKGNRDEENRDRATRARQLLGIAPSGDARRPDVLLGCAASVDPIVPTLDGQP